MIRQIQIFFLSKQIVKKEPCRRVKKKLWKTLNPKINLFDINLWIRLRLQNHTNIIYPPQKKYLLWRSYPNIKITENLIKSKQFFHVHFGLLLRNGALQKNKNIINFFAPSFSFFCAVLENLSLLQYTLGALRYFGTLSVRYLTAVSLISSSTWVILAQVKLCMQHVVLALSWQYNSSPIYQRSINIRGN